MIGIIKVEENDMMGYSGDIKYFKSLNKAKKYFKKLFNSHKVELVEDDDSVRFMNYKGLNPEKGKRFNSVVMELMSENVSENGTEYDSEFITITLEEIKIEDNGRNKHPAHHSKLPLPGLYRRQNSLNRSFYKYTPLSASRCLPTYQQFRGYQHGNGYLSNSIIQLFLLEWRIFHPVYEHCL